MVDVTGHDDGSFPCAAFLLLDYSPALSAGSTRMKGNSEDMGDGVHAMVSWKTLTVAGETLKRWKRPESQ